MTRRSVVLPCLPFPHGRAVSAFIRAERRRESGVRALRFAALVLVGLAFGSGLGIASAELRQDPARLVAFAQ